MNYHFPLSDREINVLLGSVIDQDLINDNIDLFNLLPNPDKSDSCDPDNMFFSSKPQIIILSPGSIMLSNNSITIPVFLLCIVIKGACQRTLDIFMISWIV